MRWPCLICTFVCQVQVPVLGQAAPCAAQTRVRFLLSAGAACPSFAQPAIPTYVTLCFFSTTYTSCAISHTHFLSTVAKPPRASRPLNSSVFSTHALCVTAYLRRDRPAPSSISSLVDQPADPSVWSRRCRSATASILYPSPRRYSFRTELLDARQKIFHL
jgi:hypothetical protein